MTELLVAATMDCEPVRSEIPPELREISRSGPRDRTESERSIRGYVDRCAERGLPVTLFAHPEVAACHSGLLLDYEGQGHCLGLHLHPYKLASGAYRFDLGSYVAAEQRELITAASALWWEAIGHPPLYFRAGYFSANDMTFAVLEELGFRGGSVSIPGRVLPEHGSVWVGAADYPHRAHHAFRLVPGKGRFVEVPVSVDYARPLARGAAGEAGFEWAYLGAFEYEFEALVADIVERFRREEPQYAVLVMDVHNDQAFETRQDPAARNLGVVVDTLHREAQHAGLAVRPVTLRELCAMVEQGARP